VIDGADKTVGTRKWDSGANRLEPLETTGDRRGEGLACVYEEKEGGRL